MLFLTKIMSKLSGGGTLASSSTEGSEVGHPLSYSQYNPWQFWCSHPGTFLGLNLNDFGIVQVEKSS